MGETQLSAKAKRELQAVEKSNVRLRAERLQWEEKARALEVLLRRKAEMVHRQQQFLAEIRAEKQVIDAEYQRISEMSVPDQELCRAANVAQNDTGDFRAADVAFRVVSPHWHDHADARTPLFAEFPSYDPTFD